STRLRTSYATKTCPAQERRSACPRVSAHRIGIQDLWARASASVRCVHIEVAAPASKQQKTGCPDGGARALPLEIIALRRHGVETDTGWSVPCPDDRPRCSPSSRRQRVLPKGLATRHEKTARGSPPCLPPVRAFTRLETPAEGLHD